MLDTVAVILPGIILEARLDGIQDEVNGPIAGGMDSDLMISPVEELHHRE
jgi:hypothetical protein